MRVPAESDMIGFYHKKPYIIFKMSGESMGDQANTPEQDEIQKISLEQICSRCLELHAQFDREKWKDKTSFHNDKHISATVEASDKLIAAAAQGNDPLGLNRDIQRWNENNPGAQINDINELKQMAALAFSLHDLGNIASDISIENGIITADYLDKYTAEGAEDRTIVMAKKIIIAGNLSGDEQQRYTEVVTHFVNQTRFTLHKKPDSREFAEEPFIRFVKLCDQVGNDIFSTNPDREQGLIEEGVILKKDPAFAQNRFNDLVYEDEKAGIFRAWGKNFSSESDASTENTNEN